MAPARETVIGATTDAFDAGYATPEPSTNRIVLHASAEIAEIPDDPRLTQ